MKDISSFDEYQQLALRTLNDQGTDMNIVHCAMGMAGEAGELYELVHTDSTMTGAIGELGDCAWYTAVCAHAIDKKFSDIISEARDNLSTPLKADADLLVIHGARLLEVTKKFLFYSREMKHPDIYTFLVGYTVGLLQMADAINTPLEEVCFRNINKLRERFPVKFDSVLANNRDYGKESEAAGTTIV